MTQESRRERVASRPRRPKPPLPRAPRPARPAPYDRDAVLARWSGCAYCAGPAEELDHVHPVSRGGRDVESNLVGCCRSCNAAKADLPLNLWAVTAPTEAQ